MKKALDRTFTRLLKEAGTHIDRNDQARFFYSLRHFAIIQPMYKNKVSPAVVAKQCGTGIGVLEKHYSHPRVWDWRDELVR